jgi:hypothetical protein
MERLKDIYAGKSLRYNNIKMESSNKETVLNSCFNLMRRLSPNDIGKNVAGLVNLITEEDIKNEVIQKIDQPLEVEVD